MSFNTLESKKYVYDDGSVATKMNWPTINYEQSVDGGDAAREQLRRDLLYRVAESIHPTYGLVKPNESNLDLARNYQREEIDNAGDYWKSLGHVHDLYPNNYPYKDLASRIDDVTRNETASNFLDYATAQSQNPDDPSARSRQNRSKELLMNAYINNLYGKLMNGR